MNSESTNPVALAIREFYLANLGQFSNARQCALYLGANGIVVPGIGKAFFTRDKNGWMTLRIVPSVSNTDEATVSIQVYSIHKPGDPFFIGPIQEAGR